MNQQSSREMWTRLPENICEAAYHEGDILGKKWKPAYQEDESQPTRKMRTSLPEDENLPTRKMRTSLPEDENLPTRKMRTSLPGRWESAYQEGEGKLSTSRKWKKPTRKEMRTSLPGRWEPAYQEDENQPTRKEMENCLIGCKMKTSLSGRWEPAYQEGNENQRTRKRRTSLPREMWTPPFPYTVQIDTSIGKWMVQSVVNLEVLLTLELPR